MSVTRRPRRPAWAAHIMPAAPAPITMMSHDALRTAVNVRSASCATLVAHHGRSASRLEEFAYLVEPVLRARVVRARILRVDRLELAQDLLLPRGQLHWRLDRDMAKQVAVAAAAHALDAFPAYSKNLPGLGLRRHHYLGVAVQRWDLDFAAHGRGRKTD